MLESEIVREIRDEPVLVHCSTIVENSSGMLLCVWYEGPYETSSRTVLRCARRPASGTPSGAHGEAAWSSPETVIELDGVPLGNPVLWKDNAGSMRLLFPMLVGESWTEGILVEMKSHDEGVTWGGPRLFYGRKGFMPKTRPCLLSNGTVIVPLYHEAEFCPYLLILNDPDEPYKGSLVGETMARGKVIQPAVVELSNGDVLLMGRSRTGWISQSVSHNNGNSWTICSDTGIPNPNSAVDLVNAGQNPSTGTDVLYLVANVSARMRTELSLLISEDSGANWTHQLQIVAGDGEYSYPSAIQTEDGSMWMTYTEDRYRIRAVRISHEQISSSKANVQYSLVPARSSR